MINISNLNSEIIDCKINIYKFKYFLFFLIFIICNAEALFQVIQLNNTNIVRNVSITINYVVIYGSSVHI